MSWLTTLHAWWNFRCALRRMRRALIEGDPEVRRMLEERGQRRLKR